MNPDGKGSGPLQSGSTRHPFFPGFMTSAARWWEYQRQGAPGPGLCVEPFNPRALPPCLLQDCHCCGPGESFWLLDLGCSAPFLCLILV